MEIVSDNEFQLATIQRNMNCFHKMLMQTVLDKGGGGGEELQKCNVYTAKYHNEIFYGLKMNLA